MDVPHSSGQFSWEDYISPPPSNPPPRGSYHWSALMASHASLEEACKSDPEEAIEWDVFGITLHFYVVFACFLLQVILAASGEIDYVRFKHLYVAIKKIRKTNPRVVGECLSAWSHISKLDHSKQGFFRTLLNIQLQMQITFRKRFAFCSRNKMWTSGMPSG